MRNFLLNISFFAIFIKASFAQTVPSIIKPDTGETQYIVNDASGVVNLEATNFILLGPETLIESGSTFTARIIENSENELGVVINTVNLPYSEFEIVADAIVLQNLVSGTNNSEVLVETGPILEEGNFILINVQPTTTASGLNLRVHQTNLEYVVDVFQIGNWLALSNEFYKVTDNKIEFFNTTQKKKSPFSMNLVNGVVYDKSSSLIVTIDQNVATTGSKLQIIGPNNYDIVIDPDTSQNSFIWDGGQAIDGVYQFQIELQGKFFNGQFLIN